MAKLMKAGFPTRQWSEIMKYLKVEVYIPEDFEAKLVNELNEHGYLNYNNYDYVYASCKVLGHFRPKEGAAPYIGKIGEISKVEEIKIEFRIESTERENVENLITLIHPYEEPVIYFTEV